MKVQLTEDGSHTVYSDKFGVTYHSSYGALAESNHVFIEAGLQHYFENLSTKDQTINILEMGFGTGLNALLAFQFSKSHSCSIDYTGFEKFPISTELQNELNYDQLVEDDDIPQIFEKLHNSASNTPIKISDRFSAKIQYEDIDQLNESDRYNIVFYDAFGPGTQADLWDNPILTKIHRSLRTNGVLVSYCAQGQFKRNLKSIGFKVESLPGPKGKREMTRAIKL